MVGKKLTKTQTRFIARGSIRSHRVTPKAPKTKVVAPVKRAEVVVRTPVAIQKKVEHEPVHVLTPRSAPKVKTSGALIKGETASEFITSFTRMREPLVDALCHAAFTHESIDADVSYGPEVRHELRSAKSTKEWSYIAAFERKNHGYRSWSAILEDVARVSVIQKDVLVDKLFHAIIDAVPFPSSFGDVAVARGLLAHTLLTGEAVPAPKTHLTDFLKEVQRVYFGRTPKAFSPFEQALIISVYRCYGSTPPTSIIHEQDQVSTWRRVARSLVAQRVSIPSIKAPSSIRFPLPDIDVIL
jgi:hypothetical protein